MPRIASLAAKAAATFPTPAPSPDVTPPPRPMAPALPGKLQEYAVARSLNVEPPSAKVNYGVIFHPMARKAAAVSKAIPSIQEGQMVLFREDGTILSVVKLHLLDAEQYWTQMVYDDGEVQAVSKTKPPSGSPLEEHVESLVAAYTPQGIVPARVTLRKTRTPFARGMAAALRQREGRWMDFTGTPAVESRTNRSTGKQYSLVTAHITPTTTDEARLLQEWADDPVAQAEFDKVVDAYQERLRYLDSKAQ